MDKDVIEMFREKNKMILINNLKYDIEKNINSLLETIINIFNNEFDMAIKNIISIVSDSGEEDSNKFIIDSINKLKLDSYEEIESLLDVKKIKLEEAIINLEFDEEHLNNYYDIVFETTKVFKNDLNRYSIVNVQEKGIELFNSFVSDNLDEEKITLTISRINDYLKNRLFGKLETKIHMEVMLRDNNLINKAKEGYLRYQEISAKTTNE